MCGLVGVVAKGSQGFWKSHMEVFHELLFVDTFRGDDSTGVFMVDKDGDLELLKEATDAPNFQRHKDYAKFMNDSYARGRCVIGHNRKATKGVITDENAHPFVVDNRIVLVHNGTLYGDFKKLAGEGNEVEVDSHAIAHLIHQNGDNVEKALQQLSGAYALIWFDMEKQTVNFVRNSQRPLCFMETADAIYWASEGNMLEWMNKRHDLKSPKGPQMLGVGTLVTISFEKGKSAGVENRNIELTTPTTNNWTRTGNHHNAAFWEAEVMGDPVGNACAYTPTEGESVWEEYQKELREAQEGPVKPRMTELDRLRIVAANSSNNSAHLSRTLNSKQRNDEDQLGFTHMCQITSVRFAIDSKTLRDGDKLSMVGIDFEYVNGKDNANGYLLYGLILPDFVGQANVLGKVHITTAVSEMEVLNWATNSRSIEFTQTGKSWRAFSDRAHGNRHGDGYGIVMGRDPVCKNPVPVERNIIVLGEN